ncbi:MAG: hypothetical protein LUG18_11155 [Candidatus Azobacteroides sp.]|nr:hypothetical protein [Candidatus Azobacteroides sp.]
MARREELEKEIEIAENRIKNAPVNTPKEIMDAWIKEYDSISFELNNLYEDDDTN